MVATLPSSGMNENDKEVELGLPWVTDWGADTWTYDGTSLGLAEGDGDMAGWWY
jgi:hypothetical protein